MIRGAGILAATELGISSCIMARGEETFDSDYGHKLMYDWGVPLGYVLSRNPLFPEIVNRIELHDDEIFSRALGIQFKKVSHEQSGPAPEFWKSGRKLINPFGKVEICP